MKIGSIVNGVLFQLVWFACVWGGASGRWWIAVASVLAFAWWQIPRSRNPQGELLLIAASMSVGLITDTVFLGTGLIAYPHPGPWDMTAPVWILALWAGFALTLNHSMAWLKGRPLAATLVGGGGGAFSFWVGASSWGAAVFVAPTAIVLGVLALVWAAIVPALVALAGRSHPEPDSSGDHRVHQRRVREGLQAATPQS